MVITSTTILDKIIIGSEGNATFIINLLVRKLKIATISVKQLMTNQFVWSIGAPKDLKLRKNSISSKVLIHPIMEIKTNNDEIL